ncbi:LamG-like jellyroll fold domain-containing protein [Oceanobacillus salinisoli]|uniref:LamG-like jellyroll fold domain-containing protein n=1 Tax=Oceanobacillus salinisoli TaxID=2678611 RepID=UPI001E5A1570|nr:LamG-like jellyroll fold domain-containing protein [Oceanobacillus salinisoli]
MLEKERFGKKVAIVVSAVLLLSLLSLQTSQASPKKDVTSSESKDVLAHWKFSKDYVKSGSIESGDLLLEDASGNGNTLALETVGDASSEEMEDMVRWSEDDYANDETIQSIEFGNYKQAPVGRYFRTTDDAPINSEKFEDGFTIEVIMKMPQDFAPEKHSWMGILTRQGQAADINKTEGEKEILSTLSVSNLKELQWTSHPTNLNYNQTNWSFSLDSKEDWYHVAIVNDGTHSKLYVNGVTDFRNTDEVMIGIDAVEGKGWNIGASEWANELDALFAGKIQEIRMTNQALNQENWLIDGVQENYVEYGTNEKIPLLTDKDNYNFVFVPDPQKMVRYQDEIFYEQMKWIATNKNSHNITMTAFVGDMVDRSNVLDEWIASDRGVDLLDRQRVPYLVTAGNHDYGLDDPYLDYYGELRFREKDYFKESSPSGYSSYGIVPAGNYEYLFLMVDMKHAEEDSDWAKQVLNNHPNFPTILVSHEILAVSGDGNSAVDSARGDFIWDELINDYNQVFMTVSGHNHGALHRVKENAKGNDVIQILVDYQSSYAGGNGWLRFAEFDEQDNQINFKTYSPWVEKLPKPQRTYFDVKYLNSENDQFEIDFNFEERFDFNGEK